MGGWRKSALKPSKYSKETSKMFSLIPHVGKYFDKCSFHWECNSVTLQFQDREMRPALLLLLLEGGAACTVCAHGLTNRRRCKCLLTAEDWRQTLHIALKNNPNVDDMIKWNVDFFFACSFRAESSLHGGSSSPPESLLLLTDANTTLHRERQDFLFRTDSYLLTLFMWRPTKRRA